MAKSSENLRFAKAKSLFMEHGGILRASQAIEYGLHPRTLYEMRDTGMLETLSRGLYRLSNLPPVSDPDNVTIALKVPNAVICLISALSYHHFTTQIAHEIFIALPRGAQPPRLEYPPVRVFWFTGKAYFEGVQSIAKDGVNIRVYRPAKTVADCFKYRNKIGLDVALEALREGWREKRFSMDELYQYAKICRVHNVIRPYMEALV